MIITLHYFTPAHVHKPRPRTLAGAARRADPTQRPPPRRQRLLPSGSSTVRARRRDLVSRFSCSMALSILGALAPAPRPLSPWRRRQREPRARPQPTTPPAPMLEGPRRACTTQRACSVEGHGAAASPLCPQCWGRGLMRLGVGAGGSAPPGAVLGAGGGAG